jgi:hypothetical protein
VVERGPELGAKGGNVNLCAGEQREGLRDSPLRQAGLPSEVQRHTLDAQLVVVVEQDVERELQQVLANDAG